MRRLAPLIAPPAMRPAGPSTIPAALTIPPKLNCEPEPEPQAPHRQVTGLTRPTNEQDDIRGADKGHDHLAFKGRVAAARDIGREQVAEWAG